MVIKISELFYMAAVELGHFIINHKVEFLAEVIKKNSLEYPCLYIISCDGKALASQVNKHTGEKKKKLLGRDAISKIAKWLFN